MRPQMLLELDFFGITLSHGMRLSTFPYTGLTGSANGHFGGIASTQPKTWLRQLK
jgi:hypothetical protein